MLFIFVFSLTVVLGVKSEYDCDAGPPECLREDPFPREAIIAHVESKNLFPSDEFFKASCPNLLELMECARENDIEQCIKDELEGIDLSAIYNTVTEFCNDDSELRKGYVANVDCVNNIDFQNESCLVSFENTARELETPEMRDILKGKGVSVVCLRMHLFKSCAIEIVEESCGEDAGKTAANFMTRAENILSCSGDDIDLFVETLAEMTSELDNLI